jgi:hypothetical protein
MMTALIRSLESMSSQAATNSSAAVLPVNALWVCGSFIVNVTIDPLYLTSRNADIF